MKITSAKELLEAYAKGERCFIGSVLRSAVLRSADLRYADLRSADLRYADLSSADLSSADLRSAVLRSAGLRSADLSSADLRSAVLSSADLRYADLSSAVLPDFQIVPEEGSYIAWKKLKDDKICKLLVHEKAKRTSSLVGRKCRCSKAMVLSIESMYGKTEHKDGFSQFCDDFIYNVGKYVSVKVEDFNSDVRIECASGIHHFITRKEAEEF
jgi:hypothetical protein